ncbi:Crp/Fnr family transcriptional regulator [Vibrio sp. ZSDE26]|uniref:Crp/Fnr family transcriptional regulator n=1 Tax=Vibrio amylolyticus TaxID=2847292 RepID=A0A9X2BFR0_9VIBR|nr:Crp/Fnr family transcriptional regulator [Vibrio amylolyticus]MCK6262041.1 Crp/Fnr family transcriptional regulator [Vibrio amylolyticus]
MNGINTLAAQGLSAFLAELDKRPLTSLHLEQGDVLLTQGQVVERLYWIELGEFGLECVAENGRAYSLGRHFVSQHLFGEVEFLSQKPCQFTVVANESVEVFILPITVFETILRESPQISWWLSHSLACRYQEGMSLTMKRFLHPLIYNIAWDIKLREQGLTEPVNFSQINKEATRFGCSERVYRRVLKQLIDMDLLIKRDGVVVIKDHQELENFLLN